MRHAHTTCVTVAEYPGVLDDDQLHLWVGTLKEQFLSGQHEPGVGFMLHGLAVDLNPWGPRSLELCITTVEPYSEETARKVAADVRERFDFFSVYASFCAFSATDSSRRGRKGTLFVHETWRSCDAVWAPLRNPANESHVTRAKIPDVVRGFVSGRLD